jgi:hypothetical protein
MPVKEMHIDQLKIRIPGTDRKEAGNIGQEVARRLSESLSSSFRNRHMGSLDLKLTVPPGTPATEMTESIIEAILKGLV